MPIQPNSARNFMAMSQASAPMAPGVSSSRFFPFESITPEGPIWQLGAMFASPYVEEMSRGVGVTPYGIAHDQNIYDIHKRRNFYAAQDAALARAKEADRSGYMQALRGVAALTDTPLDGPTKISMARLSDTLATFSPFLVDQAPELLDQLGGARGSGVLMADRMAKAGRYRIDPATGRFGMDSLRMADVANQLYTKNYAKQDISDMKGVTAGELGELFQELQARGLVKGGNLDVRAAMGSMHRDDINQAAKDAGIKAPRDAQGNIDVSKLSASDIDKLSATTPVGDKLRNLDVKRIDESLKGYLDAVTAMREIFGDAGIKNATIPQIMQGLETLTAGSVHQVDPAKLAGMARQSYYLAKNTGMSLDAAMVVSQDAAMRTQQLGLASPYSILARDSAIARSGADRALGISSVPVFGGLSADQHLQLESSLVAQAAASNTANTLSSALKLAELSGDNQSDIGKFASAFNQGAKEFTDSQGRTRSVYSVSQAEIAQMAKDAGISEVTASAILADRKGNQAYAFDKGITERVRNEGIAYEASQIRKDTMRTHLTGIVGADQADAMATFLDDQVMSFDSETRIDTAKRQAALSKSLQSKYGFDKSKADQLVAGSEARMSEIMSSRRDLNQFGTLSDLYKKVDPNAAKASQQIAAVTAVENVIRSEFAGMSQRTVLGGAIEALKAVDPRDPNAFKTLLAKSLGGISDTTIEAMTPKIHQAMAQETKTEKLGIELTALKPGSPEYIAKQKEFDESIKLLRSAQKDIINIVPEGTLRDKLTADPNQTAAATAASKMQKEFNDEMNAAAKLPTVAEREEAERKARIKFGTNVANYNKQTAIDEQRKKFQAEVNPKGVLPEREAKPSTNWAEYTTPGPYLEKAQKEGLFFMMDTLPKMLDDAPKWLRSARQVSKNDLSSGDGLASGKGGPVEVFGRLSGSLTVTPDGRATGYVDLVNSPDAVIGTA